MQSLKFENVSFTYKCDTELGRMIQLKQQINSLSFMLNESFREMEATV